MCTNNQNQQTQKRRIAEDNHNLNVSTFMIKTIWLRCGILATVACICVFILGISLLLQWVIASPRFFIKEGRKKRSVKAELQKHWLFLRLHPLPWIFYNIAPFLSSIAQNIGLFPMSYSHMCTHMHIMLFVGGQAIVQKRCTNKISNSRSQLTQKGF